MSFDATAMTRLRRVNSLDVSPCGRYAVVAAQRLTDDESRYVSDLWRVAIDDPTAAPVQLTRGDANDTAPRYRCDGAIGFLSNRVAPGRDPEEGEKERSQLWLLPAAAGEPTRLTDEPLGVTDFRFARDVDALVVVANVLPGVEHDQQRTTASERAKNGPTGLSYRSMPIRHWDHWRPVEAPHLVAYGTDADDRRDLTPEADDQYRGTETGLDWDLSPDGTRIAVVARELGGDRMHDTWVRVIELASGDYRDLGRADRVELDQPRWSPDGTRIACIRTERVAGQAPRIQLWQLDAGSGEGACLAPAWDVWPSPHCWTASGDAVLCTADWRAQVPVFRVDAGSGEVTRLSAEAAGGTHGNLRVAGDRVIGIRHRMHHPPEPFRMAAAPAATPELLAPLSGFTEADGAAIARWESFETAGADGAPVQSYLVIPADADGPAPALVWIHGGPIGAYSDGWHWRWNALLPAAAGYVVALPNPRGSTGFGQPFIDGVWNNTWGGACYDDLMAVTDALEARPEVDAGRIGAMGGSFGGYMANWIGGQTDRFRCLMTHAGLYHLSGFYGTTDYPAFCVWETGFGPYDDLAAYDRYSPHTCVTNWTSPTLIIHGEKDYRVPISEALMLFEALQARGVDSELLVYPDENHWILKPRNSRQWYQQILDFAAKHLKPKDTATS